MYTGCHCPVTVGQKGGGGFGKWTSVTPRGRKPIFPHPYEIGSSRYGSCCSGGSRRCRRGIGSCGHCSCYSVSCGRCSCSYGQKKEVEGGGQSVGQSPFFLTPPPAGWAGLSGVQPARLGEAAVPSPCPPVPPGEPREGGGHLYELWVRMDGAGGGGGMHLQVHC